MLTPREGYKVVTVKQVFSKDHEPAKGIRYKMIHGVVRQVPRTEVEVDKTEKLNSIILLLDSV